MLNKRIVLFGLLLIIFTFSIQVKSEEIGGNIAVSATEDIMREHGVLRRILLIYDKELKDIENNKAPQYETLFKSANIIHEFIEGYHEKQEG